MPSAQKLDTHHKALTLNLDPSTFGSFAEIGAGQEVARWFLLVGGASGTVAKTISAYDKEVSDDLYGSGSRYVSQQRLEAMLDNEWTQLLTQLSKSRGSQTRFFCFVDTVSARNFAGTNDAHGWIGLRFQSQPGGPPNEVLLHINMRDASNILQQQAIGILGVNLIYSAFYEVQTQESFLEGLAQGMENKTTRSPVSETDQNRLIKTFFEHPSSLVRKGSFHLLQRVGINNEIQTGKAIEKAVSIGTDQHQPEDRRAEAIDFISLRNPAPQAALLMRLVVPTEQLSVQLASLRTLSFVPDTTVSRYLLNQWPVLTPDLRDAAMRTFLVNSDRVGMLLKEIETGKIQPADLSFHRKVGLMLQSDEKLRNQARRLFTKNNDDEVNKAYQHALELEGDAVKGQAVYQQQCALCHQIRGKDGIALGPDASLKTSFCSIATFRASL